MADTITRKKNTGEPGNKGQFGSKVKSEAEVALENSTSISRLSSSDPSSGLRVTGPGRDEVTVVPVGDGLHAVHHDTQEAAIFVGGQASCLEYGIDYVDREDPPELDRFFQADADRYGLDAEEREALAWHVPTVDIDISTTTTGTIADALKPIADRTDRTRQRLEAQLSESLGADNIKFLEDSCGREVLSYSENTGSYEYYVGANGEKSVCHIITRQYSTYRSPEEIPARYRKARQQMEKINGHQTLIAETLAARDEHEWRHEQWQRFEMGRNSF